MAKLLPVLVLRRGASAAGDEPVEQARAQMSAENFPVALRVLPRRPRQDLTRVYTFARFVDDLGDDPGRDPDARLEQLDAVERDLLALAGGGRAELAPVAGLAPLVTDGRVPLEPFLDLVEANRIDQRVPTCETFDDLLGYCRYSAAPVGRVVLHLAGAATPVNVADSDSVCAALQVLEHCQDVGEDHGLGRCYLPAGELRDAGVPLTTLGADATPPALRRVVARQVGRSRELLDAGRPLVRRLRGWARFAVAGYVAGGLATADALAAADYDVLAAPVTPSRLRTATHALRLLGSRP